MSRLFAADRLLIAVSAAWLVVFWQTPDLHDRQPAFGVTAALIAVNTFYSLWTLTWKRNVLIGLSFAQIVLFGHLNFQLACAFGAEHYRFDREPRVYDWIEFTAAHFLRAADVLDALDEYGIHVQAIAHNSTASGLILIAMHLTVDAFLIGVFLRWLSRVWQDPPRETWLAKGRREFGWLLATLGLFVVFGVGLGLQLSDWLLWPLDNLLRLVDVGDVLQVFDWKLHGVESNYWSSGASLIFRLAAGIWMTRFVILWRLRVMQTWALSVDELTELLDDPDPQVRRGACTGLAECGPAAAHAVPALDEALRDFEPAVRVEAARALGQIGPLARIAVPRLIDAVWLGERDLRLAAVEALGRLGEEARSAVHPLVCLLKVSDAETRPAITWALNEIAPMVLQRLPEAIVLGPAKPKRRRKGHKLRSKRKAGSR